MLFLTAEVGYSDHPHQDSGRDDIERGQQKPGISIQTTDKWKAGEHRVVAQCAILHDTAATGGRMPEQNLTQQDREPSNSRSNQQGDSTIAQNIDAERDMKRFKNHAGQRDIQEKVGEPGAEFIAANSGLSANDTHNQIDKKDCLCIDDLVEVVHILPPLSGVVIIVIEDGGIVKFIFAITFAKSMHPCYGSETKSIS